MAIMGLFQNYILTHPSKDVQSCLSGVKRQLVREYQGEPFDYNFNKYVHLRIMLLSIKFSIEIAVCVLPFQPTEWPRGKKYSE